MKPTKAILAGAVAAFAFAFASAPEIAAADPPRGCPPGLEKQGRCEQYPGYRGFDRDRDVRIDRELDRAYEQGYREGRRDAELRVGQRLPRDAYRVLDRDLYYDQYGRPLDDRYLYAESMGERLLIDTITGAIVNMLSR